MSDFKDKLFLQEKKYDSPSARVVALESDGRTSPQVFSFYPRGPENLSLQKKNDSGNRWGSSKVISPHRTPTKISSSFA